VVLGGRVKEETDPLLLSAPASAGHYVPHIGFEKLDFSLLAQLYGGRPAYVAVHVIMCLYSYCALWAYAAVFASSVDSIVFEYALGERCNIYVNPSVGCSVGYTLCVFLFGAIVTWLSLQDVGDQALAQKVLTAYRFAAFATMIATCVIAFCYANRFDVEASPTPPTFASLPVAQWSGFGLIFCTTAVALDVHWNFPDVALPLREKHNALRIALSALFCAALFYTVIALVCALEFGRSTFPLATLNWGGYTGLAGGWGEGPITWWSLLVKLFIILFPVVNQCSVYPLVVLTLGDNFYSLAPSTWHHTMTPVALKRLCRLGACLPPLLLALLLGKLDLIFSVTGLFAFALEFIVPCLLQLRSVAMVEARFGKGSEWTQYSSFISHTPVVYTVLTLGCLALVISVTATLMGAGEVG
jgi:hypothetical protein